MKADERSDDNACSNELGQPIGRAVAGWQPRALPPLTPMVGRYCQLTPLDVGADAEALYRAYSEDFAGGMWTYLPVGPFASPEGVAAWLANMGEAYRFFTISKSGGSPSGVAAFMRMEPVAGSLEVGHVVFSPELQRTRAATEAMYLMMRRAFDELGYRRYEWKCDALNAKSRRAALRLGFKFEGIFRQALVYKGRNRDTAWFSIIDAEWPRLRDAFERWLQPNNFDAQGTQRTRLAALLAPSPSTNCRDSEGRDGKHQAPERR